jgi:hypothetical protein
LEFAILTDEISKAWAGLTTKEYKQLKKLKKENLRDNIDPVRYLNLCYDSLCLYFAV